MCRLEWWFFFLSKKTTSFFPTKGTACFPWGPKPTYSLLLRKPHRNSLIVQLIRHCSVSLIYFVLCCVCGIRSRSQAEYPWEWMGMDGPIIYKKNKRRHQIWRRGVPFLLTVFCWYNAIYSINTEENTQDTNKFMISCLLSKHNGK